jgi:hypothetical protein
MGHSRLATDRRAEFAAMRWGRSGAFGLEMKTTATGMKLRALSIDTKKAESQWLFRFFIDSFPTSAVLLLSQCLSY